MKSLLIALTAYSALGFFSAPGEANAQSPSPRTPILGVASTDTNASAARLVRYRGNVNVRRVPNRYGPVYRRPTPMNNAYRGARFSAPF